VTCRKVRAEQGHKVFSSVLLQIFSPFHSEVQLIKLLIQKNSKKEKK